MAVADGKVANVVSSDVDWAVSLVFRLTSVYDCVDMSSVSLCL